MPQKSTCVKISRWNSAILMMFPKAIRSRPSRRFSGIGSGWPSSSRDLKLFMFKRGRSVWYSSSRDLKIFLFKRSCEEEVCGILPRQICTFSEQLQSHIDVTVTFAPPLCRRSVFQGRPETYNNVSSSAQISSREDKVFYLEHCYLT